MADLGHGMQVVQVLEDHSYQLDEGLLGQVLLKKEIRDLPVVVVSVAGAYRGGKSFLLNFFLRYLSSPESSCKDGSWLGEDSNPLVGFNWRGGVERNTTGILLWSEPFINTLPNGEKVAILLMDTQGTFDSLSTVRDNSTIFALSTLLSSVQIYNLSMNIQEDDLQHLQLFTMYGKMVQEQDNGGKAFQTLGFLVRDWPYPYDFSFGMEGGNCLLQERLKVIPNQPVELRELRTHLRSCFEEVFCFLMPHPGFEVQNPNFRGNINDVDQNFRLHLNELVSTLFSSSKLCSKLINGQKITAGELFNYFKAYIMIFNSDQIPNPKTIVQATVEASLLSAMNNAREVYEKEMAAECGPTESCVTVTDLQEIHKKCVDMAREAFISKKTMASQVEIKASIEKLTKELDNRLPQFEQSNLSKLQATITQASDAYEQTINKITKNQPLCLHPMDFEEVHREAIQEATNIYDAQVKNITHKPDPNRAELLQNLQNRYMQLMIINEKNNKDIVKELFAEYRNFMNNKSTHPPLSDAAYKGAHEAAFIEIVNNFQNKRNRPNTFPSDVNKEELEKTINDTFYQLKTINQGKIEQERLRAEQERIRAEQEQARLEQERQRAEQERIRADQEKARAEHERELREQESIRLKQEQEKIEQERQRLEQERQRIQLEHRRVRRSNNACEIA